MFGVLLKHARLKRPLRARELSDGTLRYLCLLAALLIPYPALLAINEPETSLHPDCWTAGAATGERRKEFAVMVVTIPANGRPGEKYSASPHPP